MARIGCVVLVLVALIVGYDQYRIMQLQSEVRAISGKVHSSGEVKPAGGGSDLLTALAQAEKHTLTAKKLLKQKQTAKAQAELDKALSSLKSANGVSQDIIGDVADTMGKARDKTINVFQKAWKDISQEATKPKEDAKK